MILMEKWLDSHCRDWRRDGGGEEIAVALVLYEAMAKKRLRELLAHNVRNWGFTRGLYRRGNLTELTVDEYMVSGRFGDLIKIRSRRVTQLSVDRALVAIEKKEQEDAKKITKLVVTIGRLLLQKSLDERACLEKLWNNAAMKIRDGAAAVDGGVSSLTEQPPAKLRRIAQASFHTKHYYDPDDGHCVLAQPSSYSWWITR